MKQKSKSKLANEAFKAILADIRNNVEITASLQTRTQEIFKREFPDLSTDSEAFKQFQKSVLEILLPTVKNWAKEVDKAFDEIDSEFRTERGGKSETK